MIRSVLLIAATLLAAAPALAQEPVGCDKFKWPLDRERALLASPAQMPSGRRHARSRSAAAVTVALAPYADAKLPVAAVARAEIRRQLRRIYQRAGACRKPAPTG